jgi:hypothetical protein
MRDHARQAVAHRTALTPGRYPAPTSCRVGFDTHANSDANSDSAPDAFVPPGFFLVGGTASGITSNGLVLQVNGGDAIAIVNNGRFDFNVPLADGQPYAVTILTTPLGQDCLLTNASGIVTGQHVTTVEVTCFVRGACPVAPLTFTADGVFTLPAGCTKFTVDAFGGGGAGGAKNMGNAAAAGGRGGHATRAFINQTPGTTYNIAIGLGGTCASSVATPGGYTGGGGGVPAGNGAGADGAGITVLGGMGGAGSMGTQPGGPGGLAKFGGGGGGGGGDTARGNSAGAASTFRVSAAPLVDVVVAGGGGGAGATDQNGDIAGAGGAACVGYNGAPGAAAIAGTRSAGGGGGGGCMCNGPACASTPDAMGGLGGTAGQAQACTADQNGQPGHVTVSFP